MFLLSWLSRRRRDERRRLIFRYSDGTTSRYADPLVVDRALNKLGGPDWMGLVGRVARMGTAPPGLPAPALAAWTAERDSAVEQLATLSRTVFALPPLDAATGAGCTDADAIHTLTSFIAYTRGLADAADFLPPRSRPASPSPPASTTPPSAGCISQENPSAASA